MIRRAVLLLTASLCLSAAAPTSSTPTIYVVRHFDTPQGERDPELTEVGQRRATALVRWFSGKPLGAIYVTNFKRTHATIASLATERGLTPKLYGPAPDAALITRLRAESGPVLVVGHSNTVPDIVAALGGERPAPLDHPDFGDVWTITAGRVAKERVEP